MAVMVWILGFHFVSLRFGSGFFWMAVDDDGWMDDYFLDVIPFIVSLYIPFSCLALGSTVCLFL